jgi:hypothetical protein
MFIVPTAKRFRSQTDGSPGRPIITGTASKAELESVARRFGWTRRDLSLKDITEMSSGEVRYHEVCNPDQYAAAFAIEETKKTNDQNMAAWRVKLMWDGGATEEENQKAYAAGDRFASNYAQFIRSESNALAIAEFMLEKNLDATNVQSYVTAYENLVPLGKLVLSPKAARIGTEETLTGDDLRRYARLNLLLQPNKALRPEDKLSADEWFSAHRELHDTRTPPLIQKRLVQNTNTAEHWEQTEASTAKSGGTSVTDYPRDQHGVPPRSEKYSFRKLVGSLSSTELAQRCQSDPIFKKALDEME